MDGQKTWKVVGTTGVPMGDLFVPCLFIEYLDGSGVPQPTVFLVRDRGGYRRMEDARRVAQTAQIESVDQHGAVRLKPPASRGDRPAAAEGIPWPEVD